MVIYYIILYVKPSCDTCDIHLTCCGHKEGNIWGRNVFDIDDKNSLYRKKYVDAIKKIMRNNNKNK